MTENEKDDYSSYSDDIDEDEIIDDKDKFYEKKNAKSDFLKKKDDRKEAMDGWYD